MPHCGEQYGQCVSVGHPGTDLTVHRACVTPISPGLPDGVVAPDPCGLRGQHRPGRREQRLATRLGRHQPRTRLLLPTDAFPVGPPRTSQSPEFRTGNAFCALCPVSNPGCAPADKDYPLSTCRHSFDSRESEAKASRALTLASSLRWKAAAEVTRAIEIAALRKEVGVGQVPCRRRSGSAARCPEPALHSVVMSARRPGRSDALKATSQTEPPTVAEGPRPMAWLWKGIP
jgi:hypothetical protein